MKLSVCMRLPRDYTQIQNIWLCFVRITTQPISLAHFVIVFVCLFTLFSSDDFLSVFHAHFDSFSHFARSVCIYFNPGHFPLNFFIQGNHTHTHTQNTNQFLLQYKKNFFCRIRFGFAHFII